VTACPRCSAATRRDDRFCEECGLRLSIPDDRRETLTCCGAGITDRGLRHTANEDAYALSCGSDAAYAVVCDGVSSAPNSAEAARAAADVAVAVLAELTAGKHTDVNAVEAATAAAAKAVRALHVTGEPPSCTFVCAVARADRVTVGWLGDSRAYWLAGDASRQLTEDDAVAGTHAITRWLGADADDTSPRVAAYPLTTPGTVLLCSDGLWNYVPEAQAIATAVPAASDEPLAAARRLTDLAVACGGQDNITAVLLPLPSGHTSSIHDIHGEPR